NPDVPLREGLLVLGDLTLIIAEPSDTALNPFEERVRVLEEVVLLRVVAELEKLLRLLVRDLRNQSLECRLVHRIDVDSRGRADRQRRSEEIVEPVVELRKHVKLGK